MGSNPVAFNRPPYASSSTGSHRTNADSAASSLSSSSSAASSLPPPSPGIAGLTTAGPPFQQISERCRATPPTTPPWSASGMFGKKQSFPSTPPPAKKHRFDHHQIRLTTCYMYNLMIFYFVINYFHI